MSYIGARGWAATVVSSLVLVAGIVLLTLQWGNNADFSVYGQNISTNVALLMVSCVLAGIVLPYILKLLVGGIRDIRVSKLAVRAKAAETLLQQSEQQKAHPQSPPPQE